MAVPTLMAASILVGFFLGQWVDGKFGTEPFGMLIGLVLGMATAGREIYRLIKKVQAMTKDKEEERK